MRWSLLSGMEAATDAEVKGDREARLALFGEDWTIFVSFPEWYYVSTPQDVEPDWFTEPEYNRWDDYEVFVAPDLAVVRGYMTMDYETEPVRAYATGVAEKENGQWKMLHFHVSYAGP